MSNVIHSCEERFPTKRGIPRDLDPLASRPYSPNIDR